MLTICSIKDYINGIFFPILKFRTQMWKAFIASIHMYNQIRLNAVWDFAMMRQQPKLTDF